MRERSSPRCGRGPIRRVRISRRAAGEVERARRWWLANRDKAPAAFDDGFASLVDNFSKMPFDLGASVVGLAGVRRILLRRTRYYAYFQLHEPSGDVEILAVWHSNRACGPKLRRT